MTHFNPYSIIPVMQWIFLAYFIAVNSGYLLLNILSVSAIYKYFDRRTLDTMGIQFSGLQPPVSLLVPAYNEEASICASVFSLLNLNYPEYEVIVVNDGSKDDTMGALKREFKLEPVPEAVRRMLPTQPVRGVYLSTIHPMVRVIDKENGGKADALNAGINLANFPLFCGVDADSILQTDSLEKVVRPFLEDVDTVASGGTVRAVNGCEVRGGHIVSTGLPRNILALFQIMEYLRAYLIGRLGWSEMNALMVISGAFGVFRKDVVVEAGGYRTGSLGEDMELVVRIHLHLRRKKKRYRVKFVPDPVCWTQLPEDPATLRNQRIRWQRGLAESLFLNRELLFHRNGGAVGWVAFPFMILFELLGSAIELVGYLFTFLGVFMGVISSSAFFTFMFVAVGLGILLSVNSLLIEEMSFRIYREPKAIFILFFLAIAENFGYRQWNSWWRVVGLWRFIVGQNGGWGEMKRRGFDGGTGQK